MTRISITLTAIALLFLSASPADLLAGHHKKGEKKAAAAADNTLTDAEKSDGWELLFDGKDMSQWRNFKQDEIGPQWIIENGAMKLAKPGGADILTKKKYKDFEFKLSWKISENGNSGIFILVTENGKRIYSQAPEIQILDNERHKDNKKPNHRSGSLYDMITSPPSSHKKAGEWNDVHIKFIKRHLVIFQNGVKTAEVTVGSDEWKKLVAASKFKNEKVFKGFAESEDGHLGLQDHKDVVWFKNLKIKDLSK